MEATAGGADAAEPVCPLVLRLVKYCPSGCQHRNERRRFRAITRERQPVRACLPVVPPDPKIRDGQGFARRAGTSVRCRKLGCALTMMACSMPHEAPSHGILIM
jgi:hypothetical protein